MTDHAARWPRHLATISLLSAACASAGSRESLTPEHAAAIRDSVATFLDGYAADLSAPPIGTNVREAIGRFYASEVVMSTDLAPEEPILIQTVDSLAPPNDTVSQPGWIRSTRFEWGRRLITPLAPGLAAFTARYAEQVTDTTGTVTSLPGVQHGIVVNRPTGWRVLTIQSAHPPTTHQRQAALEARFPGPRP
jgi:hypothetical protein